MSLIMFMKIYVRDAVIIGMKEMLEMDLEIGLIIIRSVQILVVSL